MGKRIRRIATIIIGTFFGGSVGGILGGVGGNILGAVAVMLFNDELPVNQVFWGACARSGRAHLPQRAGDRLCLPR